MRMCEDRCMLQIHVFGASIDTVGSKGVDIKSLFGGIGFPNVAIMEVPWELTGVFPLSSNILEEEIRYEDESQESVEDLQNGPYVSKNINWNMSPILRQPIDDELFQLENSCHFEKEPPSHDIEEYMANSIPSKNIEGEEENDTQEENTLVTRNVSQERSVDDSLFDTGVISRMGSILHAVAEQNDNYAVFGETNEQEREDDLVSNNRELTENPSQAIPSRDEYSNQPVDDVEPETMEPMSCGNDEWQSLSSGSAFQQMMDMCPNAQLEPRTAEDELEQDGDCTLFEDFKDCLFTHPDLTSTPLLPDRDATSLRISHDAEMDPVPEVSLISVSISVVSKGDRLATSKSRVWTVDAPYAEKGKAVFLVFRMREDDAETFPETDRAECFETENCQTLMGMRHCVVSKLEVPSEFNRKLLVAGQEKERLLKAGGNQLICQYQNCEMTLHLPKSRPCWSRSRLVQHVSTHINSPLLKCLRCNFKASTVRQDTLDVHHGSEVCAD